MEKLNNEISDQHSEHERILQAAVDELNKTKQELYNKLKEERELNDMKSKFVAMTSHEFRTPLSSILSSSSIIEQYLNLEDITVDTIRIKCDKHVKRIQSSIGNMVNILNDFLSLEKLEEGKVETNESNVNIIEFSKELVDELRYTLKKGQEIIYTHQGDDSTIYIDHNLLQNTLLNLLSNASKYSPDNTPIEFSTAINNGNFEISITDHGIGIPREEQKYLFEKFFRARNVSDIRGTGLGLNIVKRYVELMKGEISFTSVENSGTTFRINIKNIVRAEPRIV